MACVKEFAPTGSDDKLSKSTATGTRSEARIADWPIGLAAVP